MKHIDTHKVYKELIASGLNEAEANAQLAAYEAIGNSLFEEIKEWFKEAKAEFASQRLISVLGGIILIALTAIGGELWYLSKEVASINIRIALYNKDQQ